MRACARACARIRGAILIVSADGHREYSSAMRAMSLGRVFSVVVVSLVPACPGPPQSDTGATATTDDACPPGSEYCECLDGGVCEPGLICASQVCTRVEVTTTSGDETGDPSSTTDALGECQPGAAGVVDPTCSGLDPSRPYCSPAGHCVDCTELPSCGPPLPACDPGSGLCVECVPGDAAACTGDAPVCDAATQTCVACTAHDQCPESACDFFTGACFPADSVFWLNRYDPNCKPGIGSEDEPFCALADAAAAIAAAGQPVTLKIHQGSYSGALVVPTKQELALLNIDAPLGLVALAGGGAGLLDLKSGAKVIADGLTLRANPAGHGVIATNANLWLDRCEISDNQGLGLALTATVAELRRSVITNNGQRGVDVAGGALRLLNTFVTFNGKVEKGGGIVAHDLATVDVLYSTLIANEAAAGFAANLRCDEDQGWKVDVRNSVIVAKAGDSLDCPATISTSALDRDPAGDGNLSISFDALLGFFTVKGGVYAAKAGTALATVARWAHGDPTTDYEGDPRPGRDGASDYAGADRVP